MNLAFWFVYNAFVNHMTGCNRLYILVYHHLNPRIVLSYCGYGSSSTPHTNHYLLASLVPVEEPGLQPWERTQHHVDKQVGCSGWISITMIQPY